MHGTWGLHARHMIVHVRWPCKRRKPRAQTHVKHAHVHMYLPSHATCTCKRHASAHVRAHVVLKNIGWNLRKPCCETQAACSAHVTHVMTAEQEKLVVEHMHIVPAIAKRLVKKLSLPFWINLDEMVSCGYIGLCKAAQKYDPARGKFETYATFRIRGNMIDDFLRKQAPIMVPLQEDNCLEYAESEDQHNEKADSTPSLEATLIEDQEHRRKCEHLAFAFTHLGEIEARVVKQK